MTIEQWSYWKLKLSPLIESKLEEMQLLGYDTVTSEGIWELFVNKIEKDPERPDPIRTHWMVSKLLRLSPNDYMTSLTVSAYKSPDWFESGEALDLRSERERSAASEDTADD
ncbi:post-transcriptional regulator [Salisediminibacterium halotolerans]|uniref:post-transcriptional regulator n=1 Tax=Salisediminibacterium halotolerans TaxID=517425 RepID=UPI000EB55F6D|nr:post-transcriptional regulator [Salisediminibacterium halotolerans]RLJ78386.1 ComN-like post-transcriptional regulator [Actinophytocola xinjiangensis]RPE88272.1 ComN-like post-transcriptional regulator [Salisediminibacterium halotolerans]TWG37362.1 ComN-like post-transcriptional regulator [Salisediminibacterium halotolerans]GEL06827.1 hypothetical protein SHA02_02430 [Salisediminibacterium halotolerans]